MPSAIPLLGLGTWKIPKDKAQDIVYHAIKELHIRHIDCACDYGNEVEVGRGINQAIHEGVVTREDLWITSKLWNTYHRYEHVLPAAQKSLTDLGLEYFDLYLIHFPIPLKFVPFETRYPPEWIHDPTAAVPRIEMDDQAPNHLTWKGMEELVDRGLARNIGVCNFNVQHIIDLLSYARIRPFSNQVELHPYLPQTALVKFCQDRNIHVTAYSPLASYSYIELGGDGGHRLMDEAVIREIAQRHGRTPAQVVLRWGTQRGTSIIPKSTNLAHLAENFAIMDFDLSSEEMQQLTELNRNLRFNDPGVYCAFMGGAIPIFN
jgi:diketogulonate reductase-like aldo/keto reductase